MHRVTCLAGDGELIEALGGLIELQRRWLDPAMRYPLEPGRHELSERFLADELQRAVAVPDARSVTATCRHLHMDLTDAQCQALLARVKARVIGGLPAVIAEVGAERLCSEAPGYGFPFHMTGQFIYPPGGYMGWHTNNDTPGHRLYISYSDPAGESYFRYRDPETGDVVTDLDRGWDFRLFAINPRRAFWHGVYSETFRYSFGFLVNFQAVALD